MLYFAHGAQGSYLPLYAVLYGLLIFPLSLTEKSR